MLIWQKWSTFNCCRQHLKYSTVFLLQQRSGDSRTSGTAYVDHIWWLGDICKWFGLIMTLLLHTVKRYTLLKLSGNWFSRMEYIYVAIQGNLPDIYTICFWSLPQHLLQSIWATSWWCSLWCQSLQKRMENSWPPTTQCTTYHTVFPLWFDIIY